MVLLVAAATNYQGFAGRRTADPLKATTDDIARRHDQSYEQLRAAHVADHRGYFDRVSIQLDDGKAESRAAAALPTDERHAALAKGGPDPALAALYFNFGRYLLINSSRPGNMPANLQGLWAEGIQTPWNCDYHIDINVQMNYWPAEMTRPGRLPHAAVQADRIAAGARCRDRQGVLQRRRLGRPRDHQRLGLHRAGRAGRLGRHRHRLAVAVRPPVGTLRLQPRQGVPQVGLPDHEGLGRVLPGHADHRPEDRLAGDRAVELAGEHVHHARRRAGARLHGPDDGHADPSRVVRQLHRGVEGPRYRRRVPQAAGRDPHQARAEPDRQARADQEWLEDYDEAEPGHRHVSHLYGLHPHDEITPDGTPELAEAAKVSLQRRGDGGTGWSMAWKVNFWARLHDGNHAAPHAQ